MAAMAAPREASRRALIVEDEASIREIVRLHLSLAGFDTEEVADGRAALDRVRTDRFDLVVLDVMLPGVDGVTICRAMRSGGPNQRSGVLMLTARDTEPDKVIGLESGADDSRFQQPKRLLVILVEVEEHFVMFEATDRLFELTAERLPAIHPRDCDVGIQPDVALSMVQLGLTLENVPTALDLEEGLAYLNQRLESGHGKQGK